MQQTSYRTAKVNQLILREIVLLLRNQIKDPRLNSIEITEVITTKDLSSSKVFFSCDKNQVSEALVAFAKAKGFIRSNLAKSVQLRHTPELNFKYDDTQQKVVALEKVLSNLQIKT
jgi:ribosome-binding factor A